MRWLDLPSARVAVWTLRSVVITKRHIRRSPTAAVTLPPPPSVGPAGERGMWAVLHRRSRTCLIRATVRQAWHASQGDERDLIIGVTRPSGGFKAHAWLDGDPPVDDEHYRELVRRRPRV